MVILHLKSYQFAIDKDSFSDPRESPKLEYGYSVIFHNRYFQRKQPKSIVPKRTTLYLVYSNIVFTLHNQKIVNMKARYIRTSTQKQNDDRQVARKNSDEKLFIDKISGAVPFSKRPQAKLLLKAIEQGEIKYMSVSSIDRLGRSTLDVLQTIDDLTKRNVVVKVDDLGLESLVDGVENPTFKLIISVLANISEMERSTLRERQIEGIKLAKQKGVYKGREKGTKETPEEILEKYAGVVNYLKRKTRPSYEDIGKLCNCSKNTVQKVRQLLAA